MAIDDAILYTRVSSDEQKKSGFSLDYQRKMGEEYAKINKLNIIKVYAESYTAKKPGRPQFNEMVDYCKKNKIKNLIFLKYIWNIFVIYILAFSGIFCLFFIII